MSPKIFRNNFDALQAIIPNIWELELHEGYRLKSAGFTDLSIEIIEKHDNDGYTISLCHYGEQNGDLMRDPEMEIYISPRLKFIEALSWRNDYVGSYFVVYPERGKVYPKQKREQNQFLKTWLDNLKNQGFRYDKTDWTTENNLVKIA